MSDAIKIHGYEIEGENVVIRGEQGGVQETVIVKQATHVHRREALSDHAKLTNTLTAYWRANRVGAHCIPEDRVGGFDS